MPCGWEGNRRSGIALAIRHRLLWFIHLWGHGIRKGDVHPASSSDLAHFTFCQLTQIALHNGLEAVLCIYLQLWTLIAIVQPVESLIVEDMKLRHDTSILINALGLNSTLTHLDIR